MHALVTWQLDYRCGIWEDVAWFSANFTAMIVEDRVQFATLKAFGGYKQEVTGRSKVIHKVVGFLWVFSFMFWSVPKWQYPKVYCGQNPKV